MSAKPAPPPVIAKETMRALLAASTAFSAAKPWELMADCNLVGLPDSLTDSIRLGCVLGNAGELFGAVVYRRAAGLRWVLNTVNTPEGFMDLESVGDMDCVKVEFTTRQCLLKEDLALLKTVNYRPLGDPISWPQFQSTRPGWAPWFIDQAEAEQLLADLLRLTAFHTLFREYPALFADHPPGQIPFLPDPLPNRPLQVADLDWRSLIIAPETIEPFVATDSQVLRLRSLKQEPRATFEFGSRLLLGSTILEEGRPCFSRINLLVTHANGAVLGFELYPATIPLTPGAGAGLVKALTDAGSLPGTLLIDAPRLETVLGPLCQALNIKLQLTQPLEFLAEANDSLSEFMQFGPP